ncbi:hypothetical protein ACJ73_03661 [Blastomyces percursus]|uniref:Uncharacterized protein n=1 Tax=Blastomyces percursus TaxID=1658174 RepID=A0A1J9QXK9_9EURO|nr:hypothetical protein ACJ73_03661 [Blastomyces percursus]
MPNIYTKILNTIQYITSQINNTSTELARVQKEVDEKAAEEQVHAQQVAEAEDQLAAQAAELERLWKRATEGAVQDTGGSLMALAQLQTKTLEGRPSQLTEIFHCLSTTL